MLLFKPKIKISKRYTFEISLVPTIFCYIEKSDPVLLCFCFGKGMIYMCIQYISENLF